MNAARTLTPLSLIATAGIILACAGAPGGQGGGQAGVLNDLTMGDAACYLTITPEGGSELILEGSFELCDDAQGFVGSSVGWRTEPAQILAASCGGDPECSETEQIDLVVELYLAKDL